MTAADTVIAPFPSPDRPAVPAPVSLERARGEVRIVVRGDGGVNRLVTLRQSGSAKARLPRVAGPAPLEAILLNTAGGLTGGDRFRFEISVVDGGAALVSSQAAERAYRSPGGRAEIVTRAVVRDGSRLEWLPQETILFERSALSRRLEADVDGDATLLAAESVVLGRAAMGETLHDIRFADSWRIRRDGRLVFADGTRLEGDAAAVMSGRATGGGARGLATVVLIAPSAETMLLTAREALADAPGESGASVWNGVLVVRMLARDGQALRIALTRLLEAIRGKAMPRVWNC